MHKLNNVGRVRTGDSRHEQWDTVSSVGLTALLVAAGRSVDTHRGDGLIADPYAEAFVEAANPPVPLPTRPTEPADDSEDETRQMMSGYMGTRTDPLAERLNGRSSLVTAVKPA